MSYEKRVIMRFDKELEEGVVVMNMRNLKFRHIKEITKYVDGKMCQMVVSDENCTINDSMTSCLREVVNSDVIRRDYLIVEQWVDKNEK